VSLKIKVPSSLAIGLAWATGVVPSGAMAQQTSEPAPSAPTSPAADIASPTQEPGIADIVVTAEKRATNLQKTPVSITAISGQALQNAQIRGLEQVKAIVPGMQMGETDGYAQITIRGIGIATFVPGADSAVALNQNEVYVSRPIAQLTGLYDVSSLEVLRGPQGTLFGRNATAGAVNISTTRPTDTWTGYGRVSIGNYAAVNAEAAVGGPIIGDSLLFRIAGFVDKHDGYGRNLVTGNPVSDRDARGIRGTLVVRATPRLKATLIGEYYKEADNGAAVHYQGSTGLSGLPGTSGLPILALQDGGFVTSNRQDTATPMDSKFRLRTTAVTGIVEWSLGRFGLKSISGYRDQNSLTLTPLGDGSKDNAFFLAGEPARQFSEELQAHYDSSRFHATGGLYYFHERDEARPDVVPFLRSVIDRAFGIPFTGSDDYVSFLQLTGTLRTTSKAVFGQASYELLDGLTLTGGIRYSAERKSAALNNRVSVSDPYPTPEPAVNFEDTKTFHSTTPKVGLQYQLSPRTLAYVSYSKGFKSGGFDVTTPSPPFQPEKLTDYEGGVKTTFLDNRLRINLAGFYYDYSNLQVLQIVGAQPITTNAATARIYGGEAEITALPSAALQLDFSASYLHARYREYSGPSAVQSGLPEVDFGGRTLNNAPNFSGHSAATYTWSLPRGSLKFRTEIEFTTRSYFTPDNIDMLSQAGYVKGNLFLTYESKDRWSVTAFVRNISNKDTWVSGQVSTPILGSPAHGAVAAPRTFGGEIRYEF
jgi:iron complex outermembrane receptor protein